MCVCLRSPETNDVVPENMACQEKRILGGSSPTEDKCLLQL